MINCDELTVGYKLTIKLIPILLDISSKFHCESVISEFPKFSLIAFGLKRIRKFKTP